MYSCTKPSYMCQYVVGTSETDGRPPAVRAPFTFTSTFTFTFTSACHGQQCDQSQREPSVAVRDRVHQKAHPPRITTSRVTARDTAAQSSKYARQLISRILRMVLGRVAFQ